MSFGNNIISQTANDGPTQIKLSHVQFSHTTQVRFVPGLDEISKDEIKATWLMEEDIATIQCNNLKTIKRMRRGKVDEENDCTRGLEYMRTADHSKQKKRNKALVLDAVLSEQKRQGMLGSYDPIKIRNASTTHSKRARDEAVRLGALDTTAASVQLKVYTSEVCHKVNITSEETQCCSITQSIKTTLESAAAATLSPPLLQRLTSNPSQRMNPKSKAQLYNFIEAQWSALHKRSDNSSKCYSRTPKRATAA